MKKSNFQALVFVFVTAITIFIASCSKDSIIKQEPQATTVTKIKTMKPYVIIWFHWDGWGHYIEYKDLDGNVFATDCPDNGICHFRVKKIRAGSTHIAPLQEDENGDFIIAEIDETTPIDEINNFQITNDLVDQDEDGNSYTIAAGIYPFDASINGYRLPVIIN